VTRENYDIEQELRKWLEGAERVVVAGIGNPIRSDDFVGVKIVQGLKAKVPGKVMLIECETVPEAYLQHITEFEPTHVLLVDAAILALRPGESRLVEPSKLADFQALSSHMLPLRIFCEYINASTKAKISLLLVQPGNTDFGEEMTDDVKAAAQEIIAILSSVFSE
jgi:hydrogenase 3 maturation protease